MADALDEFAAVAREYCAWCEGPSDRDPEPTFTLLSRLAVAASRLEPVPAHSGEIGRPTDDEYRQICESIPVYPFAYYRLPIDPLKLEAVDDGLNDLHDDLADIWRDLKAGLNAYDDGQRLLAHWEWRLSYQAHWGRHLLGAMYAMHSWIAENRKPW